jgi:hypothetical protein
VLFWGCRLEAHVEGCDRLTARGSLCRHLCWCCGEGLLLLAQEGCSRSDSSSGCNQGSSARCDSQGRGERGGHCGQVLMEDGVVVCSDKQFVNLDERGETGRLRSSRGCSSSSITSGWGLGDITAGRERMSCRVNDWGRLDLWGRGRARSSCFPSALVSIVSSCCCQLRISGVGDKIRSCPRGDGQVKAFKLPGGRA